MEHRCLLARIHFLIVEDQKLCLKFMTGEDGVMTVLHLDLLIGTYNIEIYDLIRYLTSKLLEISLNMLVFVFFLGHIQQLVTIIRL